MPGPIDVRQPISLGTVYAPKTTEVTGKTTPELGGKSVKVSDEGVGRAFRTKGTWDRFTSRMRQGFKEFKDRFVSDNSTADRRAVRFNARHEKFSGKVENLVARLASGNLADVQDPDVMATLRNDVKLLNQDAPWAGRKEILSSRLDIELGKLSGEQLSTLSENLKKADLSKLNSRDKADFETIARAVVRQEVARGEEMGELLDAIDHGSPSDVGNKEQLTTGLDKAMGGIQDKLKAFGIKDRDNGRNEDILGGAIRLRLRSGDQEKLPAMNRNLLNVEHSLRSEARAGKKDDEISTYNPALRVLSRAVREEFLKQKVGDFQDTNLRSRMKVLGSGAAHQVTKGTYEKGEGVRESRVHKFDDEELVHPEGGRFSAPKRLGIDQTNPRLLERAVVTSEYDKRLGFNVSVGTNFARHQDQIGIVMELAKGTTASNAFGMTGNVGGAQREMTKMQLLDSLTGQADRHRGNYMVDMDKHGNFVGLKAIDSDFSMGPEPDDPTKIVGKNGVHLTHLPPVIDREMAEAIKRMTSDDVSEMCGEMFDDATVAAAKSRLDAVKNHIAKLERGEGGRIIEPDEWGTDEVTKLMRESFVEVDNGKGEMIKQKTSYWQRDEGSLGQFGGFQTW